MQRSRNPRPQRAHIHRSADLRILPRKLVWDEMLRFLTQTTPSEQGGMEIVRRVRQWHLSEHQRSTIYVFDEAVTERVAGAAAMLGDGPVEQLPLLSATPPLPLWIELSVPAEALPDTPRAIQLLATPNRPGDRYIQIIANPLDIQTLVVAENGTDWRYEQRKGTCPHIAEGHSCRIGAARSAKSPLAGDAIKTFAVRHPQDREIADAWDCRCYRDGNAACALVWGALTILADHWSRTEAVARYPVQLVKRRYAASAGTRRSVKDRLELALEMEQRYPLPSYYLLSERAR